MLMAEEPEVPEETEPEEHPAEKEKKEEPEVKVPAIIRSVRILILHQKQQPIMDV